MTFVSNQKCLNLFRKKDEGFVLMLGGVAVETSDFLDGGVVDV